MGTKMAVTFANIFMASVETEIISLSKTKPLEWRRYVDDIFSLWNGDKKEIEDFMIILANRHHLTIKFTAEISNKEVNFLDIIVYKGQRFCDQGILDVRMHEPGCFGVGWPGCHVIAKLIFVAFNKHADIPANSNQPG